MVKSGLVDRVDVSQYRLSFHLITAFLILGLTLTFYVKKKTLESSIFISKEEKNESKFFLILLVLIFIQIFYVFNTINNFHVQMTLIFQT